MTIYYVQYHAEPMREAEDWESCGGAYVNCWVRAGSEEEAQEVSAIAIAQQQWRIVSVEKECSEVSPEFYSDDEAGRKYYDQALLDGECYAFHKWPAEPQEGDDVH